MRLVVQKGGQNAVARCRPAVRPLLGWWLGAGKVVVVLGSSGAKSSIRMTRLQCAFFRPLLAKTYDFAYFKLAFLSSSRSEVSWLQATSFQPQVD